MLSQQDLKSMLDRLENLARSGNKDAARQLLEQLQSMLENLQMARPGAQGDDGDDDCPLDPPRARPPRHGLSASTLVDVPLDRHGHFDLSASRREGPRLPSLPHGRSRLLPRNRGISRTGDGLLESCVLPAHS